MLQPADIIQGMYPKSDESGIALFPQDNPPKKIEGLVNGYTASIYSHRKILFRMKATSVCAVEEF